MPPQERRATLQASASVTLDASGTGQVALGPQDARGPARWDVDGIIVQTTRPGVAPIPRVQVYLGDTATPANSQGLTYDGSFNQGRVSLVVTRGDRLIFRWTGGQAGDVATATVTGTKW